MAGSVMMMAVGMPHILFFLPTYAINVGLSSADASLLLSIRLEFRNFFILRVTLQRTTTQTETTVPRGQLRALDKQTDCRGCALKYRKRKAEVKPFVALHTREERL